MERQNIAGRCQQTFENKKFVDISQQCFAFPPQVTFSAHNLNFQWRWRWWDWIQAIFSSLFYFTIWNFHNLMIPFYIVQASKQTNFLHFFWQVTHSFCKEFLQGLLIHLDAEGGLNVIELMRRIFERGTKARMLSQANHRYALNYINALNYLESLRRHNDYCDFEKVLQDCFFGCILTSGGDTFQLYL